VDAEVFRLEGMLRWLDTAASRLRNGAPRPTTDREVTTAGRRVARRVARR